MKTVILISLISTCFMASVFGGGVDPFGSGNKDNSGPVVGVYVLGELVGFGALITEGKVVTAASLLIGVDASAITILKGGVHIYIRRYVIHDEYNPVTGENNLVVITLCVDLDVTVEVAVLPTDSCDNNSLIGYIGIDINSVIEVTLNLLSDILLCLCKKNTISLRVNVEASVSSVIHIGTPVLSNGVLVAIVTQVNANLAVNVLCAQEVLPLVDWIKSQ